MNQLNLTCEFIIIVIKCPKELLYTMYSPMLDNKYMQRKGERKYAVNKCKQGKSTTNTGYNISCLI